MAWPLLVPGWTLNFEMFFYVVFTCSLLLPEWARLPSLAVALCVLVGIGLTMGPFDSAAAQVYFSPMLIEFVAGAAIGRWWRHGGRMPNTLISAILLAVGFVLLAMRNLPPLGAFNPMLGATLMVTGALCPSFGLWQFQPLRALGDSSYSLYLTHLFTLGLLRVIWSRAMPAVETLAAATLFLVTALTFSSLVGWLTFRLLETPMLHWLNARTRPHKVAAPVATG